MERTLVPIMGKTFMLVQILVISAAVSGCVKVNPLPDFSPIKISIPDIKFDSFFQTCDASEADQKISGEAERNRLSVDGSVELGNITSVDCGGKSSVVHGPLKSFTGTIQMGPPGQFGLKLSAIRVTNARTCVKKTLFAQEDSKVGTTPQLPNGKTFDLSDFGLSQAGDLGSLTLAIEDTSSRLASGLPVHEGKNMLTIEYLGKCLKIKDKPDPNASERLNCETWDVLTKKDVLVQLQIQRVETSKTQAAPAPTCPKK